MSEEKEMIARYIERKFHIEGLIKEGFFQTDDPEGLRYIEDVKDYERIEKHINHFFGFDNIFEYDDVMKDEPESNPVMEAGEWIDENDMLRVQPN